MKFLLIATHTRWGCSSYIHVLEVVMYDSNVQSAFSLSHLTNTAQTWQVVGYNMKVSSSSFICDTHNTHKDNTHTCTHTYTHEDIDTYIRKGWARGIESTKVQAIFQNEPLFRVYLRKMTCNLLVSIPLPTRFLLSGYWIQCQQVRLSQTDRHTHTHNEFAHPTHMYFEPVWKCSLSVHATYKSINAVPSHVKNERDIMLRSAYCMHTYQDMHCKPLWKCSFSTTCTNSYCRTNSVEKERDIMQIACTHAKTWEYEHTTFGITRRNFTPTACMAPATHPEAGLRDRITHMRAGAYVNTRASAAPCDRIHTNA